MEFWLPQIIRYNLKPKNWEFVGQILRKQINHFVFAFSKFCYLLSTGSKLSIESIVLNRTWIHWKKKTLVNLELSK